MPNISQKAWTQTLDTAYKDGYETGARNGERHGRDAMAAELQHQRRQEVVAILKEAAALAQANAKLTYSLHMLVEKATKV